MFIRDNNYVFIREKEIRSFAIDTISDFDQIYVRYTYSPCKNYRNRIEWYRVIRSFVMYMLMQFEEIYVRSVKLYGTTLMLS